MRVDEPILSMVAMRFSALGRDGSQRALGTLELVQLRQQGEKLCRDFYGVDIDHTGIYTGIDRINRKSQCRLRGLSNAHLNGVTATHKQGIQVLITLFMDYDRPNS